MYPIASNNPEYYIKNRTVYAICRKNFGLEFRPAQKFQGPYQNCEFPFIPRTENDLTFLMESMTNSTFGDPGDYDKTIRFWTDYYRINTTHFWSKKTNTWWSQCRSTDLENPKYSKFHDQVAVDGYNNLRNYSGNSCGCICVGKC